LRLGILRVLKKDDWDPVENNGFPVAAVDLLFVLNNAALASFFIASALFILSTNAGTFPVNHSMLSNFDNDGCVSFFVIKPYYPQKNQI
jgi:hypothetical protein